MNNKKESRGLKTRRIKRRGRVEGLRHEKKNQKQLLNRSEKKETEQSKRDIIEIRERKRGREQQDSEEDNRRKKR